MTAFKQIRALIPVQCMYFDTGIIVHWRHDYKNVSHFTFLNSIIFSNG